MIGFETFLWTIGVFIASAVFMTGLEFKGTEIYKGLFRSIVMMSSLACIFYAGWQLKALDSWWSVFAWIMFGMSMILFLGSRLGFKEYKEESGSGGKSLFLGIITGKPH